MRGVPPNRVIGSDAWMQEQQLRGEWEAAEWKRLRAELAVQPALPAPAPSPQPPQKSKDRALHEGGVNAFRAIATIVQ